MLVRYPYKKSILILIFLSFFLLALSSKAKAESDKVFSWKRLESKYTIIQYQTDEDLEKFNNQLDFGDQNWSLQQLFSSDKSQTKFDIIKNKVDMIYIRVQQILDMRKKIKKVIINIYPDREHLDEAFSAIYYKDNHIRAWYIYEFHTIYINVNDLHEGMLAHELAHSIIDNYLLVRPPAASAEILARYVDSHLHQ